MGFREDDRGISAVLGAVLLLFIVVLLFSTLQATGVPNWNEQVEFDHSQRVQADMKALRSAIVGTAADGNRRSQTVKLGTSYPQRVVLQNPGDPRGTLETEDPGTLSITNATATGEAGDYWTGGQLDFTVRPVAYTPNYNFYEDAPTTVYETGILYNRFDSANITLAEQDIVDGNRITLITVNGSLRKQGVGAASVDTIPASAPMRALTVENGSGPITIEVPTRLPNATWADALEDEYASNGGHIVDQSYVQGSPYNTLVLKLEQGVSYELKMARVGVGTGVEDGGEHYIVDVSGDGATTAIGGSQRLVVEVRDRYNNPVSNALVNASVVSGNGSVAPASERTGEDGRAVFTYTTTNDTTATIEANISASPLPREYVTFTVEASSEVNIGPLTTDVDVDPDTVQQGNSFDLSANVSDIGRGGLQIIDAEWFRNSTGDPGEGNANSMGPVDGDFDTVMEEVEDLSIDTTGWTPGTYIISVRGEDANTVWGDVSNATIEVIAPPSITFSWVSEFHDGQDGTETNENTSIPPTNPIGDVQSFDQMGADDGSDGTIVEMDASPGPGPPSNRYNIGFAIRSIPSGTSHMLQLEYVMTDAPKDVTVELVRADGTEIDGGTTYTLPSSNSLTLWNATLSPTEETYVNNGGTLYVVFETGGDPPPTEIDIDFIRVRTET